MSRVGLVLGAGGSFGWDWTVGALAALHDRTGFDGRSADQVIGTSVGSLIGSYLGHDTDLDRLARHVGGLPGPRKLDHAVAVAPSGSPPLVGPAVVRVRKAVGTIVAHLVRRPHLDPPGLGAEVVRRVDTAAWPASDLTIVAWNRSTRTRLALDQHGPLDLATSIDGSCAVPGAMPPVAVGDEELVDGGVPSMTNADLLDDGHDVIVVVAPLVLGHGPVGVSPGRFTRLVHRWTLERELRQSRLRGTPVVVLGPSSGGLDRLQTADRVDRIAQARSEAAEVLASAASSEAIAAIGQHVERAA